jgi:two-component system sensor histidine kinase ResE
VVRNSVVGKLWITIIGLVVFVLVALYVLLGQFIYNYNYEEQENRLAALAERLANVFAKAENEHEYVLATNDVLTAFNTRLKIVDPSFKEVFVSEGEEVKLPYIQPTSLFTQGQLNLVFQGTPVRNRSMIEEDQVNKEANDHLTTIEIVAVAMPIVRQGEVKEALILYQSLDIIQNTTNGLKRLTLLALLFGILLTTFFAFFLSSRITNPLRQMKTAARLMTEGEFRTRLPIRSSDEIGELADTFNHMAAQLEDNIHALSQEKDHLASILRSMVDAVITVNNKGKVILTNPPADEILLTWSEEQTDQVDRKFIPTPLLEPFKNVVEVRKEQLGDLTVHGRTWSYVMAPIYSRQQLRGAVMVLRDVTEKRRMDKLRNDFVANVSHELRTPISMVQGYSEALLDDIASTPEERQELASVIHEESLRMGRLVNDLLDLARIEAGHIKLNYSPVDLKRFVQRMHRKFAGLSKERGIHFLEELPEGDVVLNMDEDRMEQVFTNLIDNAIRHTPSGGDLKVRMDLLEDKIRIDIQDSGSGISAEDLPFIFERFYKADKARTRGAGGTGTGIGLSIVKNLIEAHGGSVSAQSQQGEGTTFSIILPWVQG